MDSNEDQRRPDRRLRQLVGADGLSLGADGGESERMGPMGDAAGAGQKGERPESREEEALRRSWCEYLRAKEDRMVMFTSCPRTRAMTAEQEKWVPNLTTHPVLSQPSTGGPSPAREVRESASNPLTHPAGTWVVMWEA